MQDKLEDLYDEIIDDLVDGDVGNCVLVLGPELLKSSDGKTYKEFCEELASQEREHIRKFFYQDNLFSFKGGSNRRHIKKRIKDFYRNIEDSKLLEQIARIKFPLIINVSPNLSLNKVYKANNIDFNHGYFSRSVENNSYNIPEPRKNNPIIYNIFGSIDIPDSLILTHESLYETLEKLLPDHSLPTNLEVFLKNARSYIFLGFNYDSWYYQLMCHKLKIKTKENENTILSTPKILDNETASLIMSKHFQMAFTNETPLVIINRLLQIFEKSDINKDTILRKPLVLGKFSLFISYAWKDKNEKELINRETIVDYIEQEVKLNDLRSFEVFRDKKKLHIGDSITAFMDNIGSGKTIIQVISDKYLKSEYCMYEAMKIYKNKGDNQVYSIVLEDIVFGEEGIRYYKKYWRERYESTQQIINNEIDDFVEKALATDKSKRFFDIHQFMDSFISNVNNQIHLNLSLKDFAINKTKVVINEENNNKIINFVNTLMNNNLE